MSNLIEHGTKNESSSPWLKTLQNRGLSLLKFLAILLAVYVVARLIAVPFMYGLFVDYLSSAFGIDDVYARPFAITLTALAIAATPTLLLAILFGYRAKTVFFTTLGLSIILAAATYFFTDNVYFNRATGESQKCYAKTVEGFKFSSTCDFDPKIGVRFQKITPEVMKDVIFWQKNGILKNVPSVKIGQYFNRLTGESIVWYSLHPDGSIHLSSLPGFDEATGKRLEPVTKEVVEKYGLNAGATGVVVVAPAGSPSELLREYGGGRTKGYQEIKLGTKWSEEITAVPGVKNTFYCTKPGAEMLVRYDNETPPPDAVVSSGGSIPCSTPGKKDPALGTGLINLRLSFRSEAVNNKAVWTF